MTNAPFRFVLLTAWLAATPLAAGAQQAPATPDQLAAITQRGRNLYAYDQAAWHGTDAARALLGSDSTGLQDYIARKTPTGWEVDFGALDSAGTSFLIRAQAQSTDERHFTAQAFAPPRSESGFLVTAAHAVATARAAFVPVEGYAYNVAVLPNDDGTLYVYLYPAQAKLNVYPVGGDARYTISAERIACTRTFFWRRRPHRSDPTAAGSSRTPLRRFSPTFRKTATSFTCSRANRIFPASSSRKGSDTSSMSTVRLRTKVRPSRPLLPRAYALIIRLTLYGSTRHPIISIS
jgi:hypothetical protein